MSQALSIFLRRSLSDKASAIFRCRRSVTFQPCRTIMLSPLAADSLCPVLGWMCMRPIRLRRCTSAALSNAVSPSNHNPIPLQARVPGVLHQEGRRVWHRECAARLLWRQRRAHVDAGCAAHVPGGHLITGAEFLLKPFKTPLVWRSWKGPTTGVRRQPKTPKCACGPHVASHTGRHRGPFSYLVVLTFRRGISSSIQRQ